MKTRMLSLLIAAALSGATAQAAEPAAAPAAKPAAPTAQQQAARAEIDRLVDAAGDEGASSGTAVAVRLSLEDSLRGVDAQLASATDIARQLPLWQQRVDLMRDVAAIEASRHYLASQGDSLDVALVAAY